MIDTIENSLLSHLRQAAWERAKGELNSILALSNYDKISKYNELLVDFITTIEEEGLIE